MRLWQPWSLSELVADLTAGRTSPADAIKRATARIAESEPQLHAWVTLDAHLGSVSSSGPMHGVPMGVKDIIDVAGSATRCGSVLRADREPAENDAAIVQRWRAAGAVPIGKTVTTEFAFFAPGRTRNPAAPQRTPGGSSSGSAAAVAAGQVPLAIGSQTAGSVTRPASYCGVAALVMSRGAIPTDGVVGLSPSLDSHGVFAARVADLALAWSALLDSGDVEMERVRPPRVLVWSSAPLSVVEPDMQKALDAACDRLTTAGAVVRALPGEQVIAAATAAHPVVMAYEAARERAEELADVGRLSEPLATLLRAGAATSGGTYEAARRTIAEAAEHVVHLHEDYDIILGPAAPGVAPEGLAATGDPILSRPWQAIGTPVVTIPGLRTSSNLPLGIQAIGRPSGERELLESSLWVEAHLR